MAIALILTGAGFAVAEPARGATYRNPVMATDFPDPTVLRVGGDYWATATNHGALQPVFQLARSNDLVNWTLVGNVFPTAPRWATTSWWAPSLVRWKGRFLLYYSATPRGAVGRCIAVAVADQLPGPWTDRGPILCGANPIDPSTTTDPTGEQLLLVWAAPGGAFVQPLSDDGTSLEGAPTNVMQVDQPWENGIAENPIMVRRSGSYVLIYSGGGCCGFSCSYGIGVARGPSPLGPFSKHAANPIHTTNTAWRCPGGQEVVDDSSGNLWFVYHAYSALDFGYAGRQLLIDRLEWRDDWPVVNGGTGPTPLAAAPFGEQGSARVQFDGFSNGALGPRWRWDEDRRPRTRLQRGQLRLAQKDTLARRARLTFGTVPSATWTAETALTRGSGGLAATWGVPSVGIEREGPSLLAWAIPAFRPSEFTVKRVAAPRTGSLRLRLSAHFNRFTLSFSADGRRWRKLVRFTAQATDTWIYGTTVSLTTRHGGNFDYMRLTAGG